MHAGSQPVAATTPRSGRTYREHLDALRASLKEQAFLFEDAEAYRAGVEDALSAVAPLLPEPEVVVRLPEPEGVVHLPEATRTPIPADAPPRGV